MQTFCAPKHTLHDCVEILDHCLEIGPRFEVQLSVQPTEVHSEVCLEAPSAAPC